MCLLEMRCEGKHVCMSTHSSTISWRHSGELRCTSMHVTEKLGWLGHRHFDRGCSFLYLTAPNKCGESAQKHTACFPRHAFHSLTLVIIISYSTGWSDLLKTSINKRQINKNPPYNLCTWCSSQFHVPAILPSIRNLSAARQATVRMSKTCLDAAEKTKTTSSVPNQIQIHGSNCSACHYTDWTKPVQVSVEWERSFTTIF